MDRRVRVIIGALVGVSAALAVALAVVIATGDGDESVVGGHMNGSDSYVGMMQAMGGMDSDAMLTHMRTVLGEDGYRRMLDHWRNHSSGGPMTGNAGVDAMMHQMMDSMMQRMPADRDRMFPLPAASATSTPVR